MEMFASENLILIEFLVDKLCIEHTIMKQLDTICGEICVSFQFFDNPPICIDEEDFMPRCPADVNFVKNGKSCLFSLTAEQGEAALQNFEISIEVYKKLNDGGESDKWKIGEALISVANAFCGLMQAVCSGDTGCSKTTKDLFKLYSETGDFIGSVGMFIRMSCFGKQLVTHFQMNAHNKSVEFKANRGHYLFKYCQNNKCDKQVCFLPGDSTRPPIGSCPEIPRAQEFRDSESLRSVTIQPQNPCYCHQPPPTCYALPTPCPPPICRQYVCPPCCRCGPPPPYRLCFAENTNVNPNEGNYQEIETQMGDSGGIKVRLHDDLEDAKKDCACIKPPDDSEIKPDTPCPGVCLMSPKCKTVKLKDGEEFDSPEMYVLRIGTRKESFGKKNNVDLEFCTPTPRYIPPPPLTDTKRMQYDPADYGKKGRGGRGKDEGS